jgi:coenzyme PQQ precursor peptide PqqA
MGGDAYIQITPPVSFGGATGGIKIMKTWTKPAVREQEVGLEVTSYLPAEIDVI